MFAHFNVCQLISADKNSNFVHICFALENKKNPTRLINKIAEIFKNQPKSQIMFDSVVGWDSWYSAHDDSQVLAKVDINGYSKPNH